jgi:colanic acid biosynthesis glycosyl transferase WcaI
MLAAGDIHLVVQRRDVADPVMPSKLTNTFAAGRPSVAMVDPGTTISEVLNKHDRCVTVPAESAAELVSGIVLLAEDGGLRERLGQNAHRYAESYLRKDNILVNFEGRLENLVRSRGKGS